jgi:hypothetical protein
MQRAEQIIECGNVALPRLTEDATRAHLFCRQDPTHCNESPKATVGIFCRNPQSGPRKLERLVFTAHALRLEDRKKVVEKPRRRCGERIGEGEVVAFGHTQFYADPGRVANADAEARKLKNPPNSLYDYNDAKRGHEPPPQPPSVWLFRQIATTVAFDGVQDLSFAGAVSDDRFARFAFDSAFRARRHHRLYVGIFAARESVGDVIDWFERVF